MRHQVGLESENKSDKEALIIIYDPMRESYFLNEYQFGSLKGTQFNFEDIKETLGDIERRDLNPNNHENRFLNMITLIIQSVLVITLVYYAWVVSFLSILNPTIILIVLGVLVYFLKAISGFREKIYESIRMRPLKKYLKSLNSDRERKYKWEAGPVGKFLLVKKKEVERSTAHYTDRYKTKCIIF
eukprot:CAMPEP_0115008422 /NCGR_PEP_ID=MMETSP0216-20121206/21916_1 /TAXON_ID=223996 /ORGANISM="Protocruzia adherens, Strain Boccale" /LENGTH=185 /DNA_ID=CAMNT_0002375853 /DNA_START=156 /DNA_END=713 /DNA_ORIENTATION=-